MAVGCGAQCAKIFLIVFNIIFWLSGAALLGLGIWMFVDDDISNYIKVFQAFEDGGAFIRYAAIVFICVGAFVLIVGFLGCCGAIKESRCMLGMYIAFLVVIMAAEIAAAVVVVFFRDKYAAILIVVMLLEILAAVLACAFQRKVTGDLEKELQKLIDKHYGKQGDDTSEAFTEGLDYVHQELECCGISGANDFGNSPWSRDPDNTGKSEPDSCCKGAVNNGNCASGAYYSDGCRKKIEDFVEDNSIILMVVGFIVAGIEIFGFIFAICLCRNVGEED